MELLILNDIVIIFGLAIGASFLCRFLKIPAIVGFLLAGALAGPHGLALINGVHEVEVMAEIGVILLLFSIGLEFSLERLLEIKRAVYIGGGIQVGLTLIVTVGAALWLDFSWPEAVFIGFLFSLSSTAVVLKLMQENSSLDSPHGRATLGILLFQDIMIVPMMILTPMLGGAGGSVVETLLLLAGKGLLLLGFVYLAAKWLIPFLLRRVAGTRNSELFLLMVVFIAFALAWTTSLLGMSLALGAFLAGLMIAESEYELQAISNILPFRDIFMSFFFISVGMLFNGSAVLEHTVTILLISLALILLKFLTASAAALFLGFSLRTILLVGFALVQIGEFSFILARTGWKYDLLPADAYPIFIAVTVITLVATPFVMGLGRFADAIAGRSIWPTFLRRGRIAERAGKSAPSKTDHVIIVGFGLVGRQLAHAARVSKVAYTVIELNPDTVRREREAGESILYGDATYREVLRRAGVESARVLVVTCHDAVAAHRITRLARDLKPEIHIIIRAQFFTEIKPLMDQGADEVIPDEFETSLEIFTRVLERYQIPDPSIEALCRTFRAKGYERLRTQLETDEDTLGDTADRPPEDNA